MHASDAAHSVLGDCRHIRRTSADIVSSFWALPIQSRQSAVLKAHCWHAQAQLTSAWLCRWHPPEERMRAAAHARQPDARHARPTNRLAPDRQPLGRIIGRKRSRFKTADTQYLQAAIGLTTCVACNCCCLSPVRSTHDVSFAFAILHFLAQHSGIARLFVWGASRHFMYVKEVQGPRCWERPPPD